MQMDFVSLRCADAAARSKLAAVDESEVLKLKVCLDLCACVHVVGTRVPRKR
jgi:hypothetical protein